MKSEEFIEKVLPVNRKLYRFAYRLLANREEAEDIVQETFMRLWNKRKNLHEYRNIDAFAMIITKNLCIDSLKSRNRNVMDVDSPFNTKDEVSPYEKTELADSVMNARQIIDHLPDQQKMIIQLRDIEGYSFEEIAEIMDLNINTIRVNLSRARKKVRDSLTKKYDYELKGN